MHATILSRARRGIAGAALLASLALPLAGCSKTKQLESVAKDWCLTIRASQVIPVYPLTEDIQPGDIFLVQVPIDRQQEIYRQRGFLPLDNHLARLQPLGYAAFYGRSVIDESAPPTLPRAWMRPADGTAAAWATAPRAAFPEYSFEVRNGVGVNIGVPVQGIPVGLSLLGSNAANGTIVMKDARTLGLDIVSLDRQLRLWGLQNADFLAAFGPPSGEAPRAYLRVVSRIYAIGSIDIFLADASSGGAGLDVGAPRPVELLQPTPPQDSESLPAVNAQDMVDAQARINESLEAAKGFAPGGSLRLASASARTVGLVETFDPPLVIGYLGFDVAIGEGGALGVPIPTMALLEQRAEPSSKLHAVSPTAYLASRAAMANIVRTLRALSASDPDAAAALAELDRLDTFVPPNYRVAATGDSGPVISEMTPTGTHGYDRFRRYEADLGGTINALEHHGRTTALTLEQSALLAESRERLDDAKLVAARDAAERQATMTFVLRTLAP